MAEYTDNAIETENAYIDMINEAKTKITTKIKKEDDEYIVQLFINGKYQKDADYFTDDKDDAKQTAKAMIKHASK